MYRKFYETIAEWENNKTKEPLLIVGAGWKDLDNQIILRREL